jgi:hypothetical protein
MTNSCLLLSVGDDAIQAPKFSFEHQQVEDIQLELVYPGVSGHKMKEGEVFVWTTGDTAQFHNWLIEKPHGEESSWTLLINRVLEKDLSWQAFNIPTAHVFSIRLLANSDKNEVVEPRPRKKPSDTGFRNRELAWRNNNREALRALTGQWIALEGEEIIAHGPDLLRVDADAQAKGIKIPYLFYVEPEDKDVVVIGL